MNRTKLQLLPTPLAICKLPASAEIPAWALQSSFFSLTRTPDELSLVCDSTVVPAAVKAEKNWRAFRVVGTLDFSLTGILASIAQPLAAAKLSIFAISTFDTDYVLVKAADWDRAREVLLKANFDFVS